MKNRIAYFALAALVIVVFLRQCSQIEKQDCNNNPRKTPGLLKGAKWCVTACSPQLLVKVPS